ncbi:MAG: 4-phosphoerythronate dehydrogenase PdxB [Gammaproteobacteria bacterium]|jgi:erythronate-4-phosphate dehydrogenase
MKIVADENIPCVEKAFSTLGEVSLLPGRGMRAADVREADILLVRSVTRVGRGLLEGSRVRFVGSATIGYDHVDREYLRRRDIGFSTAPGSNATSAAEYVVSALLVLQEQAGLDLASMNAGIIGCGNVGTRVRERLAVLGIQCLVNDPPLQQAGGHTGFADLDAILDMDIISLHVPLTHGGDYPTFHLADEAFLHRLKPGAVFINTSRGAVTDNRALADLLRQRDDLSVVLDVWEGEPAIDTGLLERVVLGTPHIAGYSLDGKFRGTEMIYGAACRYFGQTPQWHAQDDLPPAPSLAAPECGEVMSEIRAAVLAAYDIRRDDLRLRHMLDLPAAERLAWFDRLRKDYPVRREFAQCGIATAGMTGTSVEKLRRLGFQVSLDAVCA